MKAQLNKLTGMVALVAGRNISNQKEGAVFGSVPKDAGRLISGKYATLCKDLPKTTEPDGKGRKVEYETIEINAENGAISYPEREEKEVPSASTSTPKRLVGKSVATADAENEDVDADESANVNGSVKAQAVPGSKPAPGEKPATKSS